MRLAAGVLIGVSLLLGVWFIASYGRPWKSDRPSMAWLQSCLAALPAAFDVAFILSLVHARTPAWVGLLLFLLQDVIFTWRLAYLLRIRAGREVRQ